MATVELKQCDVFKTHKDVLPVNVTVGCQGTELYNATVDMSPRAVQRLRHFIQRATSPPPPRKMGEKPAKDVPGQAVIEDVAG